LPLYEYQCTKCKHTFEKIQKFSDRPVTKCPECGGKVEQLLSAPAIQFKGAGWYVTDYAKKGGASSKAGSDVSSSSESKSESQPEKKSENKSESKKESKPSSSEKK
jgi:putative FmdB family regulatory protein